MTPPFPSYAELRSHVPPGSSWSVWPDALTHGTLNHLTPDRVAAAMALVRQGTTFNLSLTLDAIDPPLFGRQPLRHTLTTRSSALYHDDVLDDFNTQAASQWDGFRHAGHPAYGWYGGVAEEEHGVAHWARTGITGRGVLLDVERWHRARGSEFAPAESQPITVADLDAALAAQSVQLEPGDILCLRTGWLQWYRGLDPGDRPAATPTVRSAGLAPGREMLAWLWDHRIAAVAADNPAVEVWPFGASIPQPIRDEVAADPRRAEEVCLHQSAIPLLGLVFGELFDFDALAAACAEARSWSFLLVAAPLGLPGGAASPANALAFL